MSIHTYGQFYTELKCKMAIKILNLATKSDKWISSGQFIFISRLLSSDLVSKCHTQVASDPTIMSELENHKIFQLAAKQFRPISNYTVHDEKEPFFNNIEPMLWAVAAKLQNTTTFIPQIIKHPVITSSYPLCCCKTQEEIDPVEETLDLSLKTSCVFIEENLTSISSYRYANYDKTCPMRLYTNIQNEGYTGKRFNP